ncbi:hypothetical protein SAMN04488109_1796 [Chryseolinea serpens]|uniref:Uncharacterized protein n=1 Tax=Chryseolinea serpens TaxID=947013 RepID=A0A1M5MKI3_9BACT|nr:hypothetical protein SAMN04488109_1796 [Chryseolinea serpens]
MKCALVASVVLIVTFSCSKEDDKIPDPTSFSFVILDWKIPSKLTTNFRGKVTTRKNSHTVVIGKRFEVVIQLRLIPIAFNHR